MIQNDVLPVSSAQRVTLVVGSYPEIPNDDIIGIDGEVSFDRDSLSRCGLSGNGDVIVLDLHISINRSSHSKYDDSRPFGITSRPQAAGSVGVQVGNRDHSPAASAACHRAVPFRARKGGDGGQWRGGAGFRCRSIPGESGQAGEQGENE